MQGRRAEPLALLLQRVGRAAVWLVPGLAVVLAVSALWRIAWGHEPGELSALASALGLTCALVGSCSAWFGRGR